MTQRKPPAQGPVLFVGRFQIYHKGHHAVVEQMVREHGQIVIGIGRAFVKGQSYQRQDPHYPFTFEERRGSPAC